MTDLTMWTVYRFPSDYPDQWVARRLTIQASEVTQTHDMFVAPTLSEIRALLPKGLFRLDRLPQDDPAIAEVWL